MNIFGDGGILNGIANVFTDIENKNINIGTVLTGINTIRNIDNLSNADLNAEKDAIIDGALFAVATAALNGLNNYAFNQGSTATTQSQQVLDGNDTIFNQSRSDALNLLNTNQQAREDFAFNQFFKNQQTGNLNDRKEVWNNLSQSQKNQFSQAAIDNFDNIRNQQ